MGNKPVEGECNYSRDKAGREPVKNPNITRAAERLQPSDETNERKQQS